LDFFILILVRIRRMTIILIFYQNNCLALNRVFFPAGAGGICTRDFAANSSKVFGILRVRTTYFRNSRDKSCNVALISPVSEPLLARYWQPWALVHGAWRGGSNSTLISWRRVGTDSGLMLPASYHD